MRIFISYRHTSPHAAQQLYEFCLQHFGRNSCFRDNEAIQAGDEFPIEIENSLSRCEVFFFIIGANWNKSPDPKRVPLMDPNDWVRKEIESVLQRRDKNEPVLIIPLLEPRTTFPAAAELPPSLQKLCDLQYFSYKDKTDLTNLVPLIEEHLGTPPMGEFGLRVISQRPDASRTHEHRFRFVKNPDDLEPFVTLSDAEALIAEANPGLEGPRRHALYDCWCQWTAQDETRLWYNSANTVRSFLVLDQKQPDDSWLPIGVSILLPLTLEGGQHLRRFTKADSNPSEKRNAATLLEDDLSRASLHNNRSELKRLLLDTWIIRRRPSLIEKPPHFEHYNWGVALIIRHISEFWDVDSTEPFTFFCEPDNAKIATMLNDLWFVSENRNAASGNLYVLKYPLDEDKYGLEDLAGIDRVKANIRRIRGMPIQ